MNLLITSTPKSFHRLISFLMMLIFLPLLVYAVLEFIRFYTVASGTLANIVVNSRVKLNQFDQDYYRAFAQGGEEAGNMLAPVLTPARELAPKLIRIDHIFDNFGVITASSGTITFDFSRLDQFVNTILETGAKPVFTLSYMPPVMAQDGQITSPPNNWPDWSRVVQKTIEHYSGTGGLNLKDIYYEVWNEPDLPAFGNWKLQGDKNYLDLYRYAVLGANNAVDTNGFFIGGPATGGMYPNWIRALLESGLRVDFLSWHSYMENPVDFARNQMDLLDELLHYPAYLNIPTLITEYGFSGNKHINYSTNFAAIHSLSVIRQLIFRHPRWLFSFQIKDGPGQLDNTGWGIISHEDNGSRKKPRFYIYDFLDKMDGTLLKTTGDGSWVTAFATAKNSSIKVMLINFDPRANHSETTPVTVTGVDNGHYSWKLDYLFSHSCAIDTPPADARANSTEIKNGIFFTNICLPPLNAVIVELTKQ